MKNALSIDLEDWYHPEFIRNKVGIYSKPQINESIKPILELLERYNTKATFFIVGKIASKNPNLIKEIHQKGHEIAFHGMNHTPLWELNYEDFNQELKQFNKIIYQIFKENIKICGYRSPTASMNYTTNYALKCLIKNGYKYDSSIIPLRLFNHGIKSDQLGIYKPNLLNPYIKDSTTNLVEFPLTVFEVYNFKVPLLGGFFFRIIPYFFYRLLLNKINQLHRPFIVYIHPWELFSKSYRVKNIGPLKYFITYFGINNAQNKLKRLLKDFNFLPLKDVLKDYIDT